MKQKIQELAEGFFEWYGEKTDIVTYTSCLLFAEYCWKASTEAERERINRICQEYDISINSRHAMHELAKRIRARGKDE